MTLKGPEFKKALLLGLVAAAIPLMYFPNTFGWSRAGAGGAQWFVVELLYYLLVFQFMFAREPFMSRVKGAFTALAFRVSLGLVFAILAATIFNVEAGQAVSDGLYGYLPAAMLHTALVPYLLKPVFRFREPRRPRAFSPEESSYQPRPAKSPSAPSESPVWTATEQVPDFDAAVAHVASYSTVGLVLLVDEEGLCVARASRGKGDSDLWAPVVNLLYDSVIQQLRRTADANVRRLQVSLSQERLVVERVEPFYFAVLCDHNTDDLVNVRIAQAVEMVKRYYEHKYPKVAQQAATEGAYV